jgi:thymidine phosphorylase
LGRFSTGAGRRKAADAIDFAVGISAIKKIGEHAERNEPLMIVHACNRTLLSSVLSFLDRAVAIG